MASPYSHSYRWLLSIWNRTRHTVLLITHDIDEAILLSDKVIVLSQRPTRIIHEFEIPFPHPRDPDELLLSSVALDFKRQLFTSSYLRYKLKRSCVISHINL